MENNTRVLKIEDDSLHFQFINGDSLNMEISCSTGTSFVSGTFFSSEYPNDSEIEKALNDIEYKLSEHKELNNNNENLVCNNKLLADMLSVEGEKKISRKALEEVFDKYVDCAYGEPAFTLGIDYSLAKLSTILIVRTIMYYLNFKEITVSNQ